MESRGNHRLLLIINGLLVAFASSALVGAAYSLFPKERHEVVTLWVHGPEAPLLGSAFWEFLISPVTSLLALTLMAVTIGKEFVVRSLTWRLRINVIWLGSLTVFWYFLSAAYQHP